MALGLLLIFYFIIAAASGICIISLFVVKETKANHIIFAITVVLGILICYLNVTSLPSNLIVPQIVAVFFGILSVIGVVLKYMQRVNAAKIWVAASVVLGVIQLFFF